MRLVPDIAYTMEEYQRDASETSFYPELGISAIYPVLGLVGESGEIAEKVKKLWRNKGIKSGKEVDDDFREDIKKEIGDVMWYIVALCNEYNLQLTDVARANIIKLQDRLKRNVIKSEGDNR